MYSFRSSFINNSMLLPLLLIFELSTAAMILPQPKCDLNLGNTNKTSSTLTDNYECFKPNPWIGPGRRAPMSDCLCAVALLPAKQEFGIFHHRGALDGYSLPAKRLFGKCAVTVEIDDGINDWSSWIAIRVVAGDLIKACGRGLMPVGNTGGTTTAGDDRRLKVTVARGGAEQEYFPVASSR